MRIHHFVSLPVCSHCLFFRALADISSPLVHFAKEDQGILARPTSVFRVDSINNSGYALSQIAVYTGAAIHPSLLRFRLRSKRPEFPRISSFSIGQSGCGIPFTATPPSLLISYIPQNGSPYNETFFFADGMLERYVHMLSRKRAFIRNISQLHEIYRIMKGEVRCSLARMYR